MPTYDYKCSNSKCNHAFEMLLSIDERDAPCRVKCPKCNVRGIQRDWITAPLGGRDATVAPGADFNRMMEKLQKGVPQRYRSHLSDATQHRGTQYGPR